MSKFFDNYHSYIDNGNVVEYWKDIGGSLQIVVTPYDGTNKGFHFPCGMCGGINWQECIEDCSFYKAREIMNDL